MYDTTRRVELVKRQIRKNTRRRQKRGIGRLSAVCMLLFAALMQTADRVVGQGQTAAWGGFGAMLLREDAVGYVLVGVAAFTAAVVLTVVSLGTRVALAYLTAGTLGVTGIWAAIPIGWVLADITGAVYYFRKRKALLPETGQ